jgi:hypothetical protein
LVSRRYLSAEPMAIILTDVEDQDSPQTEIEEVGSPQTEIEEVGSLAAG